MNVVDLTDKPVIAKGIESRYVSMGDGTGWKIFRFADDRAAFDNHKRQSFLAKDGLAPAVLSGVELVSWRLNERHMYCPACPVGDYMHISEMGCRDRIIQKSRVTIGWGFCTEEVTAASTLQPLWKKEIDLIQKVDVAKARELSGEFHKLLDEERYRFYSRLCTYYGVPVDEEQARFDLHYGNWGWNRKFQPVLLDCGYESQDRVPKSAVDDWEEKYESYIID